MSERKVLNKYYPPDFDPSKIPKMRGPKNRTFSIRIMAPFNMRCNTCGEYIYKGKKFNSRKENVEDEDYLGLRIFRFYIKCPRCVAEIAFKTDLLNTDYTLEAGATRLFEAEKLAQKMAEQERKEKEEEELNPMKVLENRTKQSRNELEQLDTLEELRDLNARQAGLNMEEVISQHQALTAQDRETLARLQEEEDTRMARELLSSKRKQPLPDPDSDEEGLPPRKQQAAVEKPTDLLTQTAVEKPKTNGTVPARASLQSKSGMAKLIVLKKKPALGSTPSTSSPTSTTDASSKTASSTSDASSKTANSTAASESSSTAPGTAVNGLGTSRTAKTSAAPAAAAGVEQSSAATGSESTPSKSSQPPQQKSGASLGLGLLGSYSDSDASDASE